MFGGFWRGALLFGFYGVAFFPFFFAEGTEASLLTFGVIFVVGGGVIIAGGGGVGAGGGERGHGTAVEASGDECGDQQDAEKFQEFFHGAIIQADRGQIRS